MLVTQLENEIILLIAANTLRHFVMLHFKKGRRHNKSTILPLPPEGKTCE